MNFERLALIGMMGSGKSTIAALLSIAAKAPWFDLDVLIEREAGMSVSEIFSCEGEGKFRQRETHQLKAITNETLVPYILSTGGGTPVRSINRAVLASYRIVWLDGDVHTLYQRIQSEGRPLVTQSQRQFESLLEARRPIYRQLAHARFHVDHRNPDQLAQLIWAWWQGTGADDGIE